MKAMKKIRLIILTIFFLFSASSFQLVSSQEKTKDEKEKELRIQEEIDKQKKAMTEQKRVIVDLEKVVEEREMEMDDTIREFRLKVKKGNIDEEIMVLPGRKSSRSFSFDEPFSFSEPDFTVFSHSMGEGENSLWDFSKSIKESNYSRNYVIDVEKSARTVIMSVTGNCKSGEIQIKIVMPNGKTYSDIVIDESGKLNWRKSFSISEEENIDKAGEWKYEIKALKATGFFKISLQTF
jgi:predicted RND superfamily exporter protein